MAVGSWDPNNRAVNHSWKRAKFCFKLSEMRIVVSRRSFFSEGRELGYIFFNGDWDLICFLGDRLIAWQAFFQGGRDFPFRDGTPGGSEYRPIFSGDWKCISEDRFLGDQGILTHFYSRR